MKQKSKHLAAFSSYTIKQKNDSFFCFSDSKGSQPFLYSSILTIATFQSIKNAQSRSTVFQNVESGCMLRHIRMGWVPLVQAVGSKYIVKTTYGNQTYSRGEFLEIRE